MKKKIISLTTFLLTILFIGNIKVLASTDPYTISAHEIPSDTYIIGTHVFTSERLYLSTQDIMWAARTIEGSSKDDMVIYYKDMNGVWVDGLTGENVTMPSTFRIEEIDGEEIGPAMYIDTVLANKTIESGTTGIGIDKDHYGYDYIDLIKEENSEIESHTIYFNTYKIPEKEYNLKLECFDEEDEIVDLGTIQPKVTVQENGFFSLSSLNIDLSKLGTTYCAIELESNNEKYNGSFYIDVIEEPEPEINIQDVSMGVYVPDVGRAGFPIDKVTDNIFSEVYNQYLTNGFLLTFEDKFIPDGDYELTVNGLKGNLEDEEFTQEVKINPPTTVTIGGESELLPNEVSINLNLLEELEVGVYQFEITLSNGEINVTEEVYIIITEETSIEETKKTIEYDDKKVKYTVEFETTGIEDGTYAIDSEIEWIDSIIPTNFELKSNQNITVEDGLFTYEFEMPYSALEEENQYRITIKLYDYSEVDGEMYVLPIPLSKADIEASSEDIE